VKRFTRDVLIVARHELADAVRSRRAVVLLLLYLAGAMLCSVGFITVLHKVEVQLAETLNISASNSTGGVTEALWQSRFFKRMLQSLAGDDDIVRGLLATHPIAVFYGWLALAATPLLVVLTTSGRIAEEVASGSVRLVLLRTSRPAWCLGKFFGQAALILVALTLSAAGTWCVARFQLSSFPPLAVARSMLIFVGRAWIYSLAFAGLALGVSQLCRSAMQATALSFLVWLGTAALCRVTQHFSGDGLRRIWELLHNIFPQAHRIDLWRQDPARLTMAITFLCALSLCYLMLGTMAFGKKDM
jgi:ABC-type transport system involved in multi-copper enzyme maturation permease subunit